MRENNRGAFRRLDTILEEVVGRKAAVRPLEADHFKYYFPLLTWYYVQ